MARQMRQFPFITLCYRRPRQLPEWRYNLFCMIHGHARESVLKDLEHMITACGWAQVPHAVLFSRRRFKQRGARYFTDSSEKRIKHIGTEDTENINLL
jgi:hypothetical protein